MKYLPLITIGLWISIITGYFFARSIFFQPIVLVPVFIILSILLPICFWILQFEKKRFFSLVFVGILSLNCAVLSYKFIVFINDFSTIEPYQSLVLDPQRATLSFSGKNEQSRVNMSKYIYETSGVITAYIDKNAELALYIPTDLDKSVLSANFSKHYGLLERKSWLKYYSLGIFLLISIQIITFVGITIYLILLEGPGGRKPIKK